jgi:hypothetical protein
MKELLPADLVTELRQFAQAYPEEVFGPVTDAEAKEHASLITRNSAAMGRHFAPWFTRAADEIERLEFIQRDFHNLDDVAEIKKLRTALEQISTTFHGNPTRYMEAANIAVEIADSALDVGDKHE